MDKNFAEVSIVFKGDNAQNNRAAFIEHMDTIEGIGGLIEGIKFHGGTVESVHDDIKQDIIIVNG